MTDPRRRALEPPFPVTEAIREPACSVRSSRALRPRLVERLQHLGRRHRQLGEAHAGGVGHGVGDGGHGRHDRRLADAAHAVGMARVRHLDDHRVDHRQVGGHRHAVVEEARVLQLAVVAVDVLLVERPADALRHAALVLALDVARVDGAAGILDRRVAQDRDLAGLGVDLDVGDVGGEARRRAVRVDARVAGDRPAGLAGDRRRCRVSVIGLCLPALGPAGRTAAVLVLDGVFAAAPTAWRRACRPPS